MSDQPVTPVVPAVTPDAPAEPQVVPNFMLEQMNAESSTDPFVQEIIKGFADRKSGVPGTGEPEKETPETPASDEQKGGEELPKPPEAPAEKKGYEATKYMAKLQKLEKERVELQKWKSVSEPELQVHKSVKALVDSGDVIGALKALGLTEEKIIEHLTTTGMNKPSQSDLMSKKLEALEAKLADKERQEYEAQMSTIKQDTIKQISTVITENKSLLPKLASLKSDIASECVLDTAANYRAQHGKIITLEEAFQLTEQMLGELYVEDKPSQIPDNQKISAESPPKKVSPTISSTQSSPSSGKKTPAQLKEEYEAEMAKLGFK